MGKCISCGTQNGALGMLDTSTDAAVQASGRKGISSQEQQRVQAQAAQIAAEQSTRKGSEIGCKNGARVV